MPVVWVALAIFCALLTSGLAYLTINYFAGKQALIYEQTLVTTQQIAVGTAITPAMFQVKSYPTTYRPSSAAQSPDQVVGRIALITIPVDVPITMDALSARGAPQSVAGELPKNGVGFFLPETALIEPVPLALVNPRDYVDVYVSGYAARTAPADANNRFLNPVVSCVPVLDLVGAGQSVPQNVVNAPGVSAASTPGFVVAMTPQQVSVLLFYIQGGTIQGGGKLALVIDRYDACASGSSGQSGQ